MGDKLFKRGECNLRLSAIRLADPTAGPTSANPPVQVLRVGKFNHPKYGNFDITPITLAEMKANFEAGIRGVDLAIDYFHDSDKEAAAWISRLTLSEDGNELWAEVEWTKRARVMLNEREVRYFSPDFAFQWTDPESNVTYRNVLFGGGLTNRPFVKDMAAIVASETKEQNEMTPEQFKELLASQAATNAAILKLSEGLAAKAAVPAVAPPAAAAPAKPDPKRVAAKAALKKQLAEYDDICDDGDEDGAPEASTAGAVEDAAPSVEEQLAEEKAKNQKLMAEKAQADQSKQMAEKTGAFNVMLSEGKVCAAQKDAFLSGDMAKFIKLAQKVNLKAAGSTSTEDGGAGEDDRADRVMKLAEEKCKADSKLEMHEAIRLAHKEVPKA